PALVVGFGPADPVADVNVERADFKQPERVLLALRAQLPGTKLEAPAAFVLERQPLTNSVGFHHPVLALEQSLPALAPVDLDHHSWAISAGIAQLLAGDIDAGKGVHPHAHRPALPFGAQARLHCVIDLAPQCPAGGIDRRALAILRRKR